MGAVIGPRFSFLCVSLVTRRSFTTDTEGTERTQQRSERRIFGAASSPQASIPQTSRVSVLVSGTVADGAPPKVKSSIVKPLAPSAIILKPPISAVGRSMPTKLPAVPLPVSRFVSGRPLNAKFVSSRSAKHFPARDSARSPLWILLSEKDFDQRLIIELGCR